MGTADGKYRIQTVAEMTGVPASTLRAWESRYGFPAPQRNESAYRVFSEDEVDLIVRVRQLCDQGVAISEAVRQVSSDSEADPPRPDLAVPGVDAEFDPRALEDGIRGAMLASEPRTVFTRMIAPSWDRIRSQWSHGLVTTARMTISSEVLVRVAWDLLRLGRPTPRRGFVVVAAWRGQRDELSGLAPVFSAQAHGYEAVSLGVDASPSVVRDAVGLLRPALVLLTLPEAPPPVQARADCDDYGHVGVRWAVSGNGASAIGEHIERAGGSVLDDSADDELRTMLRAGR